VDQRGQEPRRGGAKLCDKLCAVGDPRRRRVRSNNPGVLHHAFDLLVEFVTVSDDQDPRGRVVLQ
jgi:hypothetical protein